MRIALGTLKVALLLTAFVIVGAARAIDVVETLAGTGAVAPNGVGPGLLTNINAPFGVAVDASGNIYFSEIAGHYIRKLALDGTVSTVAGTGVAGFGGDGGPATSAQFNKPSSVAIGPDGNIYVSDEQNNRIRKVDLKTGIITTAAGSGIGSAGLNGPPSGIQFYNPGGIVFDGADLLVADINNNRVVRVNFTSNVVTLFAGTGAGGFSGDNGPATSATIGFPGHLARNAAGDIFITDSVNERIRKVAKSTGIITTVAGSQSSPGFGGDGGPALQAKLTVYQNLSLGSGLAIDASGNVYISDSFNARIRRVGTDGNINTVAGDGTSGFNGNLQSALIAKIPFPANPNFDAAGNLVFPDPSGHRIKRIIFNAVEKVGITAPITVPRNNSSGTYSPLVQVHYFGLKQKKYTANVFLLAPNKTNPAIYDPASDVYGGDATPQTGVFTIDNSDGSKTNGTLPLTQATKVFDYATFKWQVDLYDSAAPTQRLSQATQPAMGSSSLPPVITSFTTTSLPIAGNSLAYTLTATDSDSTSLSYTVDFGDGTAQVTGFLSSGTASISHTFSSVGSFRATVTVSDGLFNSSILYTQDVFTPSSTGAGITNISNLKTPVTNPLNGMTIQVAGSNGGVIQLAIDKDAPDRDGFDTSTFFNDISGHTATVTGTFPVHAYIKNGIYVATTTAVAKGTRTTAGKARKMLAISAKETGEPGLAAAPSNAITTGSLKAKFAFSGKKTDSVSYSSTIQLPPGMDLSKTRPFSVGIGNIVASTTVDGHGKGAVPGTPAVLKSLRIKYPRIKKGELTKGGENATVTISLNSAGMVLAGFDTEGISPTAADAVNGGKANRKIQVAFVLEGLAYETQADVIFTVSKDSEFGEIQSRSSK